MRSKTRSAALLFTLIVGTVLVVAKGTESDCNSKHHPIEAQAIENLSGRQGPQNTSTVPLLRQRRLVQFETILENGKPYYRFNAASDDYYGTAILKQGTNLKVNVFRARSSRCDAYTIDVTLYRRITSDDTENNKNLTLHLVEEVQGEENTFCSTYATDGGTELTVQGIPYDGQYVIVISKRSIEKNRREYPVYDFSYVVSMENDFVYSNTIEYTRKALVPSGGKLTEYYLSLVPKGKKGWYSVFLHTGWSLKVDFNHVETCPDKELFISLFWGSVTRDDLELVKRVRGNVKPNQCRQADSSRGAQLKLRRVPYTGLYTIQLGGIGPSNMQGVKSEVEIQTDSIGSLGYTGALDCSKQAKRRKLTKSHQRWKAVLHAGRSAEFVVERTGNCNGDPLTVVLYHGSGKGKDLEYIAHHQAIETSRHCLKGSSALDPARMKIRQLPYSGEYTIEVFRGNGGASDKSPIPYKIKIFSRDKDGDGISDACDRCPFTDLNEDVSVLRRVVPGVKNFMLDDDPGCSLNEAMLKFLRACSSKSRSLFRQCMRATLMKYVERSSDYKEIMKQVLMTSEDDISNECGNTLLSVRSTCGCGDYDMTLIDPKTGSRQYLLDLDLVSPRTNGFSAVAYDTDNSIIYVSECCEETQLIGIDPSTFKQVSSTNFQLGSMWDLEFVGETLYGAWRPANAAQWIGIVTMNATNPPSEFEFLIEPEYRQSREFIAFDKSSSTLWTTNRGDIVKFNAKSGAPLQDNLWVTEKGINIPIHDFKFGPGGFLYAMQRNPNRFIKIDPKTLKAKKVRTFYKWGYEGLACFTL